MTLPAPDLISKETCLLLGRKGGQNNKLIYLQDSLRLGPEEFIKVIKQPVLFDLQ